MKRPNVVFVFGDQWRAQATGYAGDPNVHTPHLDALASEGLNVTHAVAGSPVCSPSRACLLTGQTALTHGVFVNDVPLDRCGTSIAEAFKAAGYQTAYVGKWHVNDHGRSNAIPPERRRGFDYWKVLECTHNYNRSPYYSGDSNEVRYWDGYDAIAQTRDAEAYIRERHGNGPFLLMLSWGPPHAPYHTAPETYAGRYDPAAIELPPNVPEEIVEPARRDLAGYYAHCTALDDCVGRLLRALDEEGIAEDTIVVFTSDHGDMLGSQGLWKKQCPWDESIRIPFLLRYPAMFGREGRAIEETAIDVLDMMPTLLGLAGVPIPETVEGRDFSDYLQGGENPSDGAAFLACYQPFGQWRADADCPSLQTYLNALTDRDGRADILRERAGREYRGLRTVRYTYVRSLDGPWLLYDNETDPYQMTNLVGRPEVAEIQAALDAQLQRHLDERGDTFLPGREYIEEWGYTVDARGTVPYTN